MAAKDPRGPGRPGRDMNDDTSDEERAEWRDSAITFLPAVLIGFALNFWFEASLGWSARRSLFTSIAIGIAIALVAQQLVKKRGA